jgi:hypothetical protein
MSWRLSTGLSANALAELCAEDEDLPAENEAPANEKCPLLTEDLCSIYASRPFNCRCFISRTPCGEKGFADVDEVVLAVNTLFLQTVEHVDADGCSAIIAAGSRSHTQCALSLPNRQPATRIILNTEMPLLELRPTGIAAHKLKRS